MAESSSSARKTNPQKVLLDRDMTAVQQLMQLSDEDNNNNNNNKDNKKRKKPEKELGEVDQRLSEKTSAKIEEIFGKEEAYRPQKQRYRSLDSIYMETNPMKAIGMGRR
ncbi:histone-lysine N-methyltransferase, H3 lysine-79 specific-like [Quercus lobata]|uniref:Uncharacterized protein n=1 Tax=Quercus lobata TaxID=97700 RepID=A0A7N2R6J2_QUELO|nr:histone-lysine N-methyltransferase, H3 lysine-79 specific-like [Quercus lobata]